MRIKKSWIITPTVAVLVSVLGVAVAAEVGTDGTAKATGTTGTLQAVTTGVAPNHGGIIIGDIWPGHSNDVSISLHNPNSVAVKIDSITAVDVLVQGGPNTGEIVAVDGNGYANGIGTFPVINDGGTVIQKTSDVDPTYSNAFSADPNGTISNQQGVTFTVHYTVKYESD